MKVGCIALYASNLQSFLVSAFTGGADPRGQPLGFEVEDAAGHVLMRRDRGSAWGARPHAQGAAGLYQQHFSPSPSGAVYDSGTPGVYYSNYGNRPYGGMTAPRAPVTAKVRAVEGAEDLIRGAESARGGVASAFNPVPAPASQGGQPQHPYANGYPPRRRINPQNPYGPARRRYPDPNAQNQVPYGGPPFQQNPSTLGSNSLSPAPPCPPGRFTPFVYVPPSGTNDDGEPTFGGEPVAETGCKENVAGTYAGIVPSGTEAVWSVSQEGCSVIFRSEPDEGKYAGNIVPDPQAGADIVHISGAEGDFDGYILENGDLDFPTGPGVLAKQSALPEGTLSAEDEEKIAEDEAEHSPAVEEAKQEAEDAAEKLSNAASASTNNMDAEEEFVGMSLSDEEKTKVGGALVAAFVLGAAITGFIAFAMCRPKWQEHVGSNHMIVNEPVGPPSGDGNAPAAQAATPAGAPR